jgi:putative transposase
MYITYKFRLYPNQKQTIQINKTLGACRWVYNFYLHSRITIYDIYKINFNYFKCSKELTEWKNDKSIDKFQWLNEIARDALDNSLQDLDNAFNNYFREIKKGNKSYGHPKFKRKHDYPQSYRSNITYSGKVKKNGERVPTIDIKDNKIKIPKLGWVKFVKSKDFIGKIQNVTITKTASREYYISILVDTIKEQLPKIDKQIGIDLGVKTFGTTSDREVIENPKILSKYEKRIKMLSRRLSKKKKGGKNYQKARIKLAKLHQYIKNQRLDFLHKTSSRLINENQIICLESLDVSDMLNKQNNAMAKATQNVSLFEFRRILEYKAKWYGRTIKYIDQYFPSSQICHDCGYKNPEVKNLNIREWTCPNCGEHHDRDVNAALNILHEGLKQIS